MFYIIPLSQQKRFNWCAWRKEGIKI